MAETSTKPYMLRALHEWCTDNGYTPQIAVQVDANTMVPPAHIRDGQITLNIGTLATNRLVIGNDAIEFQARFSGVTENLYVPIGAVTAIYARETGAGMGFEVEAGVPDNAATAGFNGGAHQEQSKQVTPSTTKPTDTPKEPEPKRPTLTIVK
jgi:stringent starvation protein B